MNWIPFFILASLFLQLDSISWAQEAAPTVPPVQSEEAQAAGPSASEREPDDEKKAAEKALEQPEEERRPVAAAVAPALTLPRRKGQIHLDLSLTYVHSSSNQLFINGFTILPVLVVGQVTVERIRRDSFAVTLVGRYGLIEGLNVQLSVPFAYSLTQVSEATGTIQPGAVSPSEGISSRSAGIGDITLGLSYEVLSEKPGRPKLLAGLAFKGRTGRDLFETDDPTSNPPTGTGFNSVGGSLSVVKTTDPAVVFASLSYSYAIPRDNVVFRPPDEEVILIDFAPGDNAGLSAGLAYALNNRLSMSFQYQQSITFPTRINGVKSGNSIANTVAVRIGGGWRINEKRSVNVGISRGLTLDAPDVQVSVSFPWRLR